MRAGTVQYRTVRLTVTLMHKSESLTPSKVEPKQKCANGHTLVCSQFTVFACLLTCSFRAWLKLGNPCIAAVISSPPPVQLHLHPLAQPWTRQLNRVQRPQLFQAGAWHGAWRMAHGNGTGGTHPRGWHHDTVLGTVLHRSIRDSNAQQPNKMWCSSFSHGVRMRAGATSNWDSHACTRNFFQPILERSGRAIPFYWMKRCCESARIG